MCGICGAVWSDPRASLAPSSLTAMMDQIVHRGPDDSGQYRDDHAALGFRRLSIIDLEGGDQPIGNEDGSVQVCLQRRDLQPSGPGAESSKPGGTAFGPGGVTPRSLCISTKTRERGCSRCCGGMFALAIWDAPRRTLVLARDRLGQKPLVYRHDRRGRLVFASELKALLALPESDRAAPA